MMQQRLELLNRLGHVGNFLAKQRQFVMNRCHVTRKLDKIFQNVKLLLRHGKGVFEVVQQKLPG